MFDLHEQLARDTTALGDLGLCRVLLMENARYPWCILVPRLNDISEIYQLTHSQQHQLIDESSALAQAMCEQFRPDKMNIAALGNRVPQLHIHHIARTRGDDAWPQTVWDRYPALPYLQEHRRALIESLCLRLAMRAPAFLKNEATRHIE